MSHTAADAITLLEEIRAFADVLADDDLLDLLLYNEVEHYVVLYRYRLSMEIVAMHALYGVDSAEACTHLELVSDYLLQLASERATGLKRIITHTTTQDTSHGLIAFELYQDVTRGLEIVELNPEIISNPNAIREGTELQVYDR